MDVTGWPAQKKTSENRHVRAPNKLSAFRFGARLFMPDPETTANLDVIASYQGTFSVEDLTCNFQA